MPDVITGELLFRNVSPSHYDPDVDQLDPAALWPTSVDQGWLSSDRDSVWTPEQSYQFRTDVIGRPSSGVLALATDELMSEWNVETTADPLVNGVDDQPGDNPAHALSDFTHLTTAAKADRRRVREALLLHALEQGWQHGPI